MGSSVTAGHDSPFNKSFPILTGELMAPAFQPLGINVISRNAAMGNNPCVPYDMCPRAFAGLDADIVHWEQTYNCGGYDDNRRNVFEQFIRQSISLPSHPIVVFMESSVPNWKKEDCVGKSTSDPNISDKDKLLLKNLNEDPIKIVSELNIGAIKESWSANLETFKEYKVAGIQLWNHKFYEDYKCRGPYTADWGCCSASWHPSLKGHELSAAHYAYFWLLIYKDALNTLINSPNESTIESLLKEVKRHLDAEAKHLPPSAIYQGHYADSLQCFTTFQPIANQQANLNSLIIPNSDSNKQFKLDIFENFVDKNIITKARSRGYLDYKYMLYGNSQSNDPLSLKIHVNKKGYGFICQPPGNWGVYPDKFTSFWLANTLIYLTENTNSNDNNFVFDKNKAKLLSYTPQNPKDTQFVCAEFNDQFNDGDHILTIVPQSEKNIMISYLLLP
eukprot:gene24737-32217_t